MDETSEKPAQPSLAAALDRLWARFLAETRERVAVIDAAVQALAAGSLSTEQKESAASAAHKLAGVLGTFSLARGTELARELELQFSASTGLAPDDAERLASHTAELRSLIENRR
jgi:HPt (histidine-containing phosphotransfer) domain-containing protein